MNFHRSKVLSYSLDVQLNNMPIIEKTMHIHDFTYS